MLDGTLPFQANALTQVSKMSTWFTRSDSRLKTDPICIPKLWHSMFSTVRQHGNCLISRTDAVSLLSSMYFSIPFRSLMLCILIRVDLYRTIFRSVTACLNLICSKPSVRHHRRTRLSWFSSCHLVLFNSVVQSFLKSTKKEKVFANLES